MNALPFDQSRRRIAYPMKFRLAALTAVALLAGCRSTGDIVDGGVYAVRSACPIAGIPAGTGVLVKAPKQGQDRRIDLPSIGPKTIDSAINAGLNGIAVVAGSAIVAEPNRIAEMADRANLFVVGVRDETAPQ